MRNLRVGRCLLFSAILYSGCATSSYQVLFQDDGAAEIRISPDRVLLECEYLYDADESGLYGFMMHILDDQHRVTTVVQGNTLDRESCENRVRAITKILKEGNEIYVAGRGNLDKVDPRSDGKYRFLRKGAFPSSGKTLSFVAIANEQGLCYDAYSGFRENPCPPEPFPFWKKRPKRR